MIIQSLIMVKLLRSDGYLLKELDMPNSPLKEIMMLHFAIGLLNEYYYLFNKHKNGANRRSYSVYSFLSVYGIYAVYRSFYNKREWLLFLG